METVRFSAPARGLLERIELGDRGVLHPTTAIRLISEGKLQLPLLLNGREYLPNNDGQLFVGLEKIINPDQTAALVFQAWFVLAPGLQLPRFELPFREEYGAALEVPASEAFFEQFESPMHGDE